MLIRSTPKCTGGQECWGRLAVFTPPQVPKSGGWMSQRFKLWRWHGGLSMPGCRALCGGVGQQVRPVARLTLHASQVALALKSSPKHWGACDFSIRLPRGRCTGAPYLLSLLSGRRCKEGPSMSVPTCHSRHNYTGCIGGASAEAQALRVQVIQKMQHVLRQSLWLHKVITGPEPSAKKWHTEWYTETKKAPKRLICIDIWRRGRDSNPR
jgi:hypothetical protein